MKWKEFKELAESMGAQDDFEVAFEDPNFGGNHSEIDPTSVFVDNNEVRIQPPYWEPVD